MSQFHQIITYVHIPFGFIGLFLFWVPAFAKKGGKIHVMAGKLYYFTMWAIVITAAILSINNLILDNPFAAGFLGFLTVITALPLWSSRAILKEEAKISIKYFKIRKYFNVLIVIMSAFLIVTGFRFGIKSEGILFLFFGLLGIGSVRDVMQTYDQVVDISRNKVLEHLKGTIITGIAAHTAFFAFGGRRFISHLLDGYLSILPWILPTVIGLIAINYLSKKYKGRRKTRKIGEEVQVVNQ